MLRHVQHERVPVEPQPLPLILSLPKGPLILSLSKGPLILSLSKDMSLSYDVHHKVKLSPR